MLHTKGQLISEWIFSIFKSPKKPTKFLTDFCPGFIGQKSVWDLKTPNFHSESNWHLATSKNIYANSTGFSVLMAKLIGREKKFQIFITSSWKCKNIYTRSKIWGTFYSKFCSDHITYLFYFLNKLYTEKNICIDYRKTWSFVANYIFNKFAQFLFAALVAKGKKWIMT